MKRKCNGIIIGFLLSVLGCENIVSKEEAQKAFYGKWYSEDSGYYIDILPDCNLIFYQCTLHDGIQINESIAGHLSGIKLTISDDASVKEYRIEGYAHSSQKSTAENMVLNDGTHLIRVDSIPKECENDVIEIIDVLPDEVISGDSTDFTVFFEYRLTSVNKAIIEVGLTSSEEGSFLISKEINRAVDSTKFAKDTLQVTAIPKLFENGTKCYLSIFLRPIVRYEGYIPYSFDRFELNVTK